MRFFKPCAKCMTMRAKVVRWLGIKLGVMEPIKEQSKKDSRMEMSQDQIFAIIGTKEVEIIALRLQLAEVMRRLAKYEPPEDKKLEVVK